MSRVKSFNKLNSFVKINLKEQDKFIHERGVVFEHYAAVPSPIGLQDRGDYRRPDYLDTFSENGFIYKKIGEFPGVIVGNAHNETIESSLGTGGEYDDSTARLVLPRKYTNLIEERNDDFISLLPGDRLYIKDAELKVDNYQLVTHSGSTIDTLQFPATDVFTLIDSKNKEYKQGLDFVIEKGNIKWIGNTPGLNPTTGKGNIYAIRYQYLAFWYVTKLLNEIRITNVEGETDPQRLPYHAIIQREYVYHNKKQGTHDQVAASEKEKPFTPISPEEKALKDGRRKDKPNDTNLDEQYSDFLLDLEQFQ